MKESRSPYFSIVIPSYNQAEYLKECLDSIGSQSFDDWEVTIMDGGSTDGSVEIIKKFALKYKDKVRWRSAKDKGQVWAINSGLSKTRGQIVSYLNSDDKYEKNTLKIVKKVFEANECEWIYGDCKVLSSNLRWTFTYKSMWPVDIFPQLLYLLNPINQPSVFLRRSFVKKIGSFDDHFRLAFDYEYWLRAIEIAKPLRIRKPLSMFRVHKDSKGSTQYSKQFNEELRALRKHNVRGLAYVFHKFHNFLIIFVYRLLK